MNSHQTADAVVIGAGAVGCAAALLLARRGLKPLVIERDGIAFNASAYAWGGLSAHFGSGVPGPMTDHYREAISRHIDLYEELKPQGDHDWQLQRVTSLSLADNEKSANRLAADVDWMRSEGFEAEMIGSDELYGLEPAIRGGFLAASIVNAGWELDSLTFTVSLANEAERQGVHFLVGQVAEVDIVGGAINSVVLKGGDRVDTPVAVAATGPWVSNIRGIPRLPIKPIKGEILRLEHVGDDLRNRVGFNGFNVGRKPDCTVWAGTYEWDRGFDRNVTEEGRQHIWNGVTDYLPTLSHARMVKTTACLRPVARDGIPIVGGSSAIDGLYYANGAGKKGILLAPLMAEWLSSNIVDGDDIPPIFSPDRFEAV
ncbi:MAG: FAD-binding oxidoreductase [Chloroflexi bacterium]|nr:FAD-binding oxidoreductase [Chloroflexota bacterium]